MYDVIEVSQRWCDPSYGNGGGDYRTFHELIKSHGNMIDATNHRDRLNKLEEGNYNARD